MKSDYTYIRQTYSVPAARTGARVRYRGGPVMRDGTITGECNGKLRIRLDGDKHAGLYHPTWELTYLDPVSAK